MPTFQIASRYSAIPKCCSFEVAAIVFADGFYSGTDGKGRLSEALVGKVFVVDAGP